MSEEELIEAARIMGQARTTRKRMACRENQAKAVEARKKRAQARKERREKYLGQK